MVPNFGGNFKGWTGQSLQSSSHEAQHIVSAQWTCIPLSLSLAEDSGKNPGGQIQKFLELVQDADTKQGLCGFGPFWATTLGPSG